MTAPGARRTIREYEFCPSTPGPERVGRRYGLVRLLCPKESSPQQTTPPETVSPQA